MIPKYIPGGYHKLLGQTKNKKYDVIKHIKKYNAYIKKKNINIKIHINTLKTYMYIHVQFTIFCTCGVHFKLFICIHENTL